MEHAPKEEKKKLLYKYAAWEFCPKYTKVAFHLDNYRDEELLANLDNIISVYNVNEIEDIPTTSLISYMINLKYFLRKNEILPRK